MSTSLSRRQFIAGLGAGTVVSTVSLPAFGDAFHNALNEKQQIRFGYAAITWEGNDVQAIKDIAELGFRGIQLRSNLLKEFGERPQALRSLLLEHKLEMVAFSSGGVRIDPKVESEEIAKHTSNARFVRAVGGRYLQVTDSARPQDRKPEASDFKELGRILTEIGKRAHDIGIPVGYHNHMGSLGESPEEVDRIMEAVDPRFVKLELDIAHYQQGGGDPVRAIRQYRDRLLFLHIKDVENLPQTDARGRAYRFVELGRGRVNLVEVFAALKEVKFNDWAIIELDAVPDKARTPKESARISMKYLEDALKMKVI